MKLYHTTLATLVNLAIYLMIASTAVAQSYLQLTQPIAGRAMRSSSNLDPDWDHGGQDYQPLGPGQSLTIANLTGPGIITHLWFTFGNNSSVYWDGAPRDLELSFYWDDETSPSVHAPVGDFFAVGNGKTAYLESAMAQIGGNVVPRAYNCYWPMPFAHQARLVIRNNSLDKTMDKTYFHVDWIKYDQPLPATMLYFHAEYRVRHPLPVGEDYTVADITGKGHYVGTVFSNIYTPGKGFGEGDERMFIDGDIARPSIVGTGMEDYFGESWGFHSHNSLYHGFTTLSDGSTMYRWHIKDPIPFHTSFKLTFENWGSTGASPPFDEITWTEWSSVAFWYQQDQPQPAAQTSGVEFDGWNSFE